MKFSVHQVTRRATGGEIARTRTLETDAPVIGRGAECDIHLPDLAVDLRHARLTTRAGGIVVIEALGGLGFEVDGRFTRLAELNPAKGADVVIGRYRLAFSLTEPDEVRISVSSASGAADTPSGAADTALFAPRAVFLGRRPLAWALGLTVLLACLAIPTALFFLGQGHRTIQVDQQWTSGPLSTSHAFLQNNCQACHVKAFVAVRDDACLSCHAAKPTAAQLAAAPDKKRADGGPPPILIRAHAPAARLRAGAPLPSDLSRRLTAWLDGAVNHPNDRCASCHVEHVPLLHHGTTPPILPRPIPLLKTVNSCADCHQSLRSRLPKTALADTPSWVAHPEFRPLVPVAYSGGKVVTHRVNLAQTSATFTGLIFSHRVHLLAGGGVARLAVELGTSRGYGGALGCAACHHADATGRGFVAVTMERDCRGCHTLAVARTATGVRTLPNGSVEKLIAFVRSFSTGTTAPATKRVEVDRRRPGEPVSVSTEGVGGKAQSSTARMAEVLRASAAPGGSCAFCHVISSPPLGSIVFVVAPVPQLSRHLPAGAFDHGLTPHHQDARGRATCGTCHAAQRADAARDLILPSIQRCAACHGNRRALAPGLSNCEECHGYHEPGRSRLTLRDREQIAAWRPALIKVSQATWLDHDR